MPPAEGPETDPGTGLVPAIGHPAHTPARHEAHLVGPCSEQGLARSAEIHAADAHHTRSLCGAMECIHRPTLYLHPNLRLV